MVSLLSSLYNLTALYHTLYLPRRNLTRITIPLARNTLYTKMLLHPKTCVVPVLPSKLYCSSLMSRIFFVQPTSSLVIALFFICLYLRPFPRCLLINHEHSNRRSSLKYVLVNGVKQPSILSLPPQFHLLHLLHLLHLHLQPSCRPLPRSPMSSTVTRQFPPMF